MINVDDILAHYGKKGMHWGTRTSRSVSKGSKKSVAAKPKAKDLSDEELRKAVNRMNMEKQYNSLVGNKTAAAKGAEFAKGIAGTAVKTALTAVATQQVAKAIKTAKIVK